MFRHPDSDQIDPAQSLPGRSDVPARNNKRPLAQPLPLSIPPYLYPANYIHCLYG